MKELESVQSYAPYQEVERVAIAIAKSGLFGVKDPAQAVALCLIAQAEGLHPAIAARDYNVIQGRPAKTTEAIHRAFLLAGGRVEWHSLTDDIADATFSHPQGGTFRCTWDVSRAKTAGLAGKEMWKKYPRQMLRARCVSEGCRTVFPGATSGMYTPEEVRDSHPEKEVAGDRLFAPHDETEVESLLKRINASDTLDALDRLVPELAKVPNGAEKNEMRRAWKARKAALGELARGLEVKGKADEANKPSEPDEFDEPIGQGTPRHRTLLGFASEIGLEDEEIRTWCYVNQRLDHGQELDSLTRSQYTDLMDRLPGIALRKKLEEIDTFSSERAREVLSGPIPAWLYGEASGQYVKALTERASEVNP